MASSTKWMINWQCFAACVALSLLLANTLAAPVEQASDLKALSNNELDAAPENAVASGEIPASSPEEVLGGENVPTSADSGSADIGLAGPAVRRDGGYIKGGQKMRTYVRFRKGGARFFNAAYD